MKFTHFAGLALLALSFTTTIPASAQSGRNGQIHIVKDCGPTISPGTPGSFYCKIIQSNLPELPANSLIYYDQITAGPTAGAGFLDSNIFVYVQPGQWAVGRCTIGFDGLPGLCTLTDGIGALTGIGARVVVTYQPGGDGALYTWDGTYSFAALPVR